MAESCESREAPYGKRTIVAKVVFFTNDIAKEGKGYIKPKHGWTQGMVRMEHNEFHGIIPKEPRPFNSLMELPEVIERVLIENGIKLHHNTGKMAKYIK